MQYAALSHNKVLRVAIEDGTYEQVDKKTIPDGDTEVADPDLLKALVAHVNDLKDIIDKQKDALSALVDASDLAFDVAKSQQDDVTTLIEGMTARKQEFRNMKAEIERQDKGYASLQRDHGSLMAQVKDLQAKLSDEKFQREMLDSRLVVLATQVDKKIAGAEGGVVKVMESSMPGTTWKIEIEGGKR